MEHEEDRQHWRPGEAPPARQATSEAPSSGLSRFLFGRTRLPDPLKCGLSPLPDAPVHASDPAWLQPYPAIASAPGGAHHAAYSLSMSMSSSAVLSAIYVSLRHPTSRPDHVQSSRIDDRYPLRNTLDSAQLLPLETSAPRRQGHSLGPI